MVAAIARLDKHEEDKSSAEYAELVDRLALVLEHRGDHAAAEHRWTEAAAIYEALTKPAATDDRQLERQMQYYQNLEAIYQQLNKWDDAIRVTRRLLEHREQSMLPDDPNIWRAKSALGAFYGSQRRHGAKPLLVEAAAYWRTRVPAAPMELARTLNNLAEVARSNGGYAEALKYLEEAVPICQRIYARDDVRLADVYSNLAGVLSAQGRYKAAIDQYRQAVEICRAGGGPTTRRAKELLATTLVNTAMLYKSQRQFREAAHYCADALEVQRAATGADESGLVPFYSALASLYLAQDQAHPTGPAAVSVDLGQAASFTRQAHDLCQKYDLSEQPAQIVFLAKVVSLPRKTGRLAQVDRNRGRSGGMGLVLRQIERRQGRIKRHQPALVGAGRRALHFQRVGAIVGRLAELPLRFIEHGRVDQRRGQKLLRPSSGRPSSRAADFHRLAVLVDGRLVAPLSAEDARQVAVNFGQPHVVAGINPLTNRHRLFQVFQRFGIAAVAGAPPPPGCSACGPAPSVPPARACANRPPPRPTAVSRS